ncbi:hypothetical protein HBA12_03460 [Tenacibaculum mesophilum]|uniref:hypothetical protein n=1 Tax=Tenacibaculum mesophilum TaxID=104268 RepID=UPI00143099D0|nr:hypothetical protein [Tenacibaculum mesophilum]KAF9659317.1 hypothetical protein HBA12_03460 [Tenacibaculum mesophilum]
MAISTCQTENEHEFNMDKNEFLLRESFRYIDNNPNALSNEIPNEFIDFWMVEDIHNFNLEETGDTNQGAVFMYSLIKQKSEKGLTEFSIEPEKLMKMYQDWQLVLITISLNNLTDLSFEPFKVFDFDNFNKLEFIVSRK